MSVKCFALNCQYIDSFNQNTDNLCCIIMELTVLICCACLKIDNYILYDNQVYVYT